MGRLLLPLVLTLLAPARAIFQNCRDGFCYDVTFPTSSRAWSYVKETCNNKGGHVFSFNSTEELDHVVGLVSGTLTKSTDAIYIGTVAGNKDLAFSNGRIKSDAQSAAWTWQDGSSVNVELIN